MVLKGQKCLFMKSVFTTKRPSKQRKVLGEKKKNREIKNCSDVTPMAQMLKNEIVLRSWNRA